jgi:hypothetical protein
MQRENREPAFPMSRREWLPLMSRGSPLRGMIVPPTREGDSDESPLSGFFDIFRLAARTHWPLSDALKSFAAFLATVVLALHPLIKLDIDRSTDRTHGFITRLDIWRDGYKTLS